MSGGALHPKVIYVALDACDTDLLLQLAAEGRCPNLAALLPESAVVDTIAPYGTFVGSSWMTIATGAEVSTHRYWNWLEVDRSSYGLRPTTPRESLRPPFWQALSDAGRRVAVLDVPHADLPDTFNGVLIKEWGCHDRHHGTASHPATVLEELESRFGRHPYGSMVHPEGSDAFAPCDYTLRAGPRRTRDEERQLAEAILRGVHVKAQASLAVLDQEPWDLFATVHGESHCVGHQLWHLHDPDHERHDPATRALIGDPTVAVYEALDASIGEHLRRAGPDTTVWVQTNHGMGPHHDGDHLLDEVLRRLDPMVTGAHHGGWRTRAAGALLEVIPRRLRSAARTAVARAVRWQADAQPPALSHPTGPSPDRSFYPVPGNTTVGAVRFNVRGRESKGVIDPGPPLEALRRDLAAGLLELVDVDTGRAAVRAVVFSDEVLERAPDDALPDLFVEWERTTLMERVWSPRVGTVAARYDHWRTGDHHDRGLVVVRGPGIRPGRRPVPMSLVDVAPTICATVGVELPEADGRPRSDLLPHPAAGAEVVVSAVRRPSHRRPLRSLQARGRPQAHRPEERALADSAIDLAVQTARQLTAVAEAAEADRAEAAADRRRLDATMRRIESLERERAVWATTAWLANEPVVEAGLISVITPTRRRPEKLRRAIDSVLAQRYPWWELVVVDDGGDSAKSVVAEVGDSRITYHSTPHRGVCAARNTGLDAARGSMIAYLDDDNTLDPGWLHAVAWAFANHPEHQVLYGARVIDDDKRVEQLGTGGFPFIQLNPFDRAALEQGNFADMGVLAHRAGAPGAHFDEAFWECGDWDFLLSLTQDADPLVVPAVAFYYRTDGDDRLTGRFVDHEGEVRQKWARWRADRDAAGTGDLTGGEA